MPTVSVIRCDRYHRQTLHFAIEKLLEPFGGIYSIVRPGQKVLLKPNMLSAARPAEAVSTHPAVMQVVTELVQDAGGRAYIGDSPGNDDQEKAHHLCGMKDVMEVTGAEMLLFKDEVPVNVAGFWNRPIPLAAELRQVDLVINMGKLKTHSLTGLTGAVKNIYGCVVGGHKKRFHLNYPLPLDFSRLLIDVYLAVKPVFSILDAVVAMEGTGPRKGRPRQLGLLMASPNAVALDCTAAAVTGFQPWQVPTITAAREMQLAGADLKDIDIKGVPLEECRATNFDRGPAASGSLGLTALLYPLAWLGNMLTVRSRPYPHIDNRLCTRCGICYENCPAQVISSENGQPVIDLEGCIRCYCCQELCPEGSIKLSGRRG